MVQPGKDEAQGNFINACKYLKGVANRSKLGSCQWCPVTGQKETAISETQEVLSEREETLLHCEGDRALPTSLPPQRYL